MAYQTGTATDHTDLLAKIIAFAVSGGGWTNIGTAAGQTTGAWLRGPGLSGTENIYAGLQLYADAPSDTYGLEMRGAQGFIAANSFSNQPGTSPTTFSSSWNTTMPYWIAANGQRVIAVWKVSTTYHALHFGKILPYSTPSEYGYPVYIAGESSAIRRWSYQNFGYRHFTDPGNDVHAYLCYPDGGWQSFANYFQSSGSESSVISSYGGRGVWPYMGAEELTGGSTTDNYTRALRENIDGSYTLLPLILHGDTPSRAMWGEIDGAFYVSGANNAAENVITISGQNYIVFQNIYRSSRHHYWALKAA